jgi:hypothetical protein
VALLFAATGIYAATAAVFWTIQGLDFPGEYVWFVRVSLIIHTAHGLFWDAMLWGWYYYNYSDNAGAAYKPVPVTDPA